MERPDKTIGKGKQDFILFDETERQDFPMLPAALSIEEAVALGRYFTQLARPVYAAGKKLTSRAEEDAETELDMDNFVQSMNQIDGEIRMDRADQFVELGAKILELCEPEVRKIKP